MIKLFDKKEECSGCGACVQICPEKAIEMKPDEYGFVFPEINNDICIECGLCIKVCPFKRKREDKKPLLTFAAQNKDKDILSKSASGGIFGALAVYVLNDEGVVFGCTLNESFKTEHISVDKINEIYKLQGSKYVQSDTKDTFKKAKKFLDEQKTVLFSGTPCQIDGLKSFLGKDYERLITVELICHGVPSETFFKSYIEWKEKTNDYKIKNFIFRDKIKNGMGLKSKIYFENDNGKFTEEIAYANEYYLFFYIHGDISRESCYVCPYACGNRPGDITIGDYWGIEKAHPQVNTDNGISVVLVNNEKGKKIIPNLNLELTESDFEKATPDNRCLYKPTEYGENRDKILEIFIKDGAESVNDYFKKLIKSKRKFLKIKRIFPESLKKRIKKLIYKR